MANGPTIQDRVDNASVLEQDAVSNTAQQRGRVADDLPSIETRDEAGTVLLHTPWRTNPRERVTKGEAQFSLHPAFVSPFRPPQKFRPKLVPVQLGKRGISPYPRVLATSISLVSSDLPPRVTFRGAFRPSVPGIARLISPLLPTIPAGGEGGVRSIHPPSET